MIDMHSHILPGIDDGPDDIEESFEMCRMASADGIKTVVATPHYYPGLFAGNGLKALGLVDRLNDMAREAGLDLKIVLGSELKLAPELPLYIKEDPFATINRTGRYVLMEFAPDAVPPNWVEFLGSVMDSGVTPVIAHPERNLFFMRSPGALYPAVRRGIMVQITAMSLTGELGPEIEACSAFLLKHNLCHIMATDSHSTVGRTPRIAEAVRTAAVLIGGPAALSLVTSAPMAVINGERIALPAPIEELDGPFKKKKWIRTFFN